jgi:hypothetical protein
VVSCPMPSTSNEKDPLTICSISLDSYQVVGMVNPSMEDLKPNISLVTTFDSLDIYYFHIFFLSSNEDHLETMVKVHEHSSLYVSR